MTDIATLKVTITADSKGLDDALARIQRQLEELNQGFSKGQSSNPFEPVTRNAPAAQASILQLARAEATLLATQGDLEGAQARLAGALSQVEQGSLAAIRGQTQLAGLQNRIAKEASGATSAMDRLAGGVGALGAAAGALGLAEVASQIVQFGAGAVASANELERTQAIMQQLAGSSQRYAEIVKLAEQNQTLFGGSLNENLTPLNALLQLSNRTGAELSNLNDVSQLLLASSPGKAFEDASFALSEFLSNNGAEAALSLADQFNLNKVALQELATEGTTASERLQGLTAILAEQGVTAETLAAATSTNAASYAQAGAAVDTLRVQLGQLLAEGFAPFAAGTTDAATSITNFITSLTGADSPMAQYQAQLAAMAPSYEEYRAAAEQSAVGTEVFVAGVVSSLGAMGPFAQQIADFAANMGILTKGEYEAAAGNDELAASVQNATTQYQSNYTAVTDAATASRDAATASNADAVEKLAQAAAAEQTAASHAQLEAAIRSAAAGSETGAAAAARIAGMFNGVEAPAVMNLIGLYRQMAAEKANATGTKVNNVPANKRLYQSTGVPQDAIRSQQASARSQQEMARAEKARRDQIVATGSATQVASLREQEYAAAVKQYGASSAEAIQAETRLMQAREAAQRATTKGAGAAGAKGKGAKGGKSPETKAAEKNAKAAESLAQKQEDIAEGHQEKLADIEERAYEERLAAEERYQERVLEIQERYAEEQLEAQRDLQAESAGSRADFYESLINSDLPPDISASLSAAYEAAFAEAQRLSQEGQAELAADYLALKERQLKAEADFQEKAAKLREKAAKGGAEGKEAANDLKKLEQIKALRDKQFEAEETNLKERGDSNVTQRDEALADADADRVEALAEAERKRQEAIGEAGEAAQKRLADAQEKTAQKIAATNTELTKQLDLLNKTGGLPAAAAAPTPAPAATPADVAVAAQAAPGAAAGAGVVVSSAPTVEAALAQVSAALASVERALRARPNYTPGA